MGKTFARQECSSNKEAGRPVQLLAASRGYRVNQLRLASLPRYSDMIRLARREDHDLTGRLLAYRHIVYHPSCGNPERLIDCASTCRSCRERALWVAPPLLLLDGACTQRSSCLLRELLIPHHLMKAASKPSFITQPWVPHRKRVIHLPSCHVCHRNRVIQLPSCFDS